MSAPFNDEVRYIRVGATTIRLDAIVAVVEYDDSQGGLGSSPIPAVRVDLAGGHYASLYHREAELFLTAFDQTTRAWTRDQGGAS